MKGRALVLASALGFAVFGALSSGVVASCTSTQTVVTLAGVCNGTVTLSVASPGDGACIEPSADLSIPVTVEALNFALRPAGASCAFVCNCGFVRLYVDGVLNNISGTAVVDANLKKLAMPYGTHTLTAELVWDQNDGGGADLYDAGGSTDAGPDGGPTGALTKSITVTVAPSCQDAGLMGDGGPGDAGSGDAGPTDAGPTDAGSGDAGPTDAGPTDAGPADAGDGGDGG